MASWPTFPIQGSRLVSAFRGDFNDIVDALVTTFVGATAPATTYACMLWADTSQGVLKQRNVANTAWNVVKELDTDYGGMLSLAGGTMEGSIDMDGNSIINLPAGSGNSPARYADLASYVKADGTVAFTGFPTLPSSSPSADYHASHKKYVDDRSTAGGTFTGQISMTVAPSTSQHVMRKTDVEAIRDTHTHQGGTTGSKLTASAVNSQTAEAGYSLRADGAGNAAFVDQRGDRSVWLESPTQVASLSNSATWQEVDLSTYVSTDCVSALVWPIGSSLQSSWIVKFRKYAGAGSGFVHEGIYYTAIGRQIPYRMTVPINGRKLEVWAERTYGEGTLLVNLDAYYRRV